MPEGLLPLFPLEVVLLPHATMPLHVFEERYKEMVSDCLRTASEFGVVQSRGNGILRIGCSASIEEVLKRYDDGRLDILSLGRRRFEIQEVDSERAYLSAKVTFFDDDDFSPAPGDLRRRALITHAELLTLVESDEEPPDINLPDLSFHLARISTDLDFRQLLLDIRSESERMQRVSEHLSRLIVQHRTRNVMKRVIRQNGHGTHLGDLSSRS